MIWKRAEEIAYPGFRTMEAFTFGSPKRTTDPVERISLPDSNVLLKKAPRWPMVVQGN
jgi:hypothetical protein